jgi:hypothetical protein
MDMVHKTYILPGVSDFVDTAVLAQYPPTSIKRIVAAVFSTEKCRKVVLKEKSSSSNDFKAVSIN